MRNRRGHIGVYLAEALLTLICIAAILILFRFRAGRLDVPLLILWGAVLLVFVPLLARAERRLLRAEKRADSINDKGKDKTSEK